MNKQRSEKIELTGNDISALRAERDRTGVGAFALLKGQRQSKPDGLTDTVIGKWLSGQTETARAAHLEFVKQLWAALPDAPKRIEITTAMLDELSELVECTGLGASAIVTAIKSPPEKLHPGTIQQWLNGKMQTARADHWGSVLKLLRSKE